MVVFIRNFCKQAALLLCLSVFPLMVHAKVELSDQLIEVSVGGLEGLQRHLTNTVTDVIVRNLNQETDSLDNAIECRELKEIRAAYLCMTYFQQDLNDAFTRIGIFMGSAKEIKAGTLLTNDAHVLVNYKKLVIGHNLLGKVIEAFYQSATTSATVLNPFERLFFQGFVQQPNIQKLKGNYYVIGLSVQSTQRPLNVLSHEIYHAQYALTPGYKAVVRDFWKTNLSQQDRLAIKAVLGQFYNLDENILLDEFQAYLVQTAANEHMLQDFVTPYQSALRKAFTDAGIQLVKVTHGN